LAQTDPNGMSEQPRRWIGGALEPVPSRVRAVAEPIIEGFGLSLLGTELGQEGHRQILWVYLDHPDGVSIVHCAQVSPELSAALDVDDPVPGTYELRVSSPGVERPLMSDVCFRAQIGQEAIVQLSTPLQGRRKFTGVILDADEVVRLRCADGEHDVPIAAIQRARLRIGDLLAKPRSKR
jgi:ribosome maturation factor RimP